MTIRQKLDASLRRMVTAMYSGFALFAAGGLLSSLQPCLVAVALVGFALFGSSIAYVNYGLRCPRCGNPIGCLPYLPKGGYYRFAEALKFCPFCGVNFDSELPAD